jgi:hypothetical protein
LARVLAQIGKHERSHHVIARWVQDQTDDQDAMRILLEVDRNAEHSEEAIQNAARLAQLESACAQRGGNASSG